MLRPGPSAGGGAKAGPWQLTLEPVSVVRLDGEAQRIHGSPLALGIKDNLHWSCFHRMTPNSNCWRWKHLIGPRQSSGKTHCKGQREALVCREVLAGPLDSAQRVLRVARLFGVTRTQTSHSHADPASRIALPLGGPILP